MKNNVDRWGIYSISKKLNKQNFVISNVIEKPNTKEAPSNNAVFEESTSYENNDNKFELKKYEDSIKINMIESINENIILYLQNLNY